MSSVEDGPVPAPLPKHPVTSVALLARARAGDPSAWEVLTARFVPTLRAWALVRIPVGATLPDVAAIVRSTLERMSLDHEAQQRDGSFFFALRQELGRCLHQAILSNVEPRRIDAYERRLLALDAIEREAIVLHLEMRRDFETIAMDLAVADADDARGIFQRAFMKLAKEMSHEH